MISKEKRKKLLGETLKSIDAYQKKNPTKYKPITNESGEIEHVGINSNAVDYKPVSTGNGIAWVPKTLDFNSEKQAKAYVDNREMSRHYGTNLSYEQVKSYINDLKSNSIAAVKDPDYSSKLKFLNDYSINYGYKNKDYSAEYLKELNNKIEWLENPDNGADIEKYLKTQPNPNNEDVAFQFKKQLDELKSKKASFEAQREVYKRTTVYEDNYKKFESEKDYSQKVEAGKKLTYEQGNKFDLDEKAYNDYRNKYGDDEYSDWGAPEYVTAYDDYYNLHFDLLKDNEKNTYYYLLATDKKAAEKYLDDMKKTLNVRATSKRQAEIDERYKNASGFEKVSMNLDTIANKPKGYIESAIGNLIGLFDEDGVDPYDNLHAVSNDVNYTRAITAEDIENSFENKNVGKFVATAYQSGMSIADMGVLTGIGVATGGSGTVSGIAFGLDSANSYLKSAYDRGLSKGEMYTGAVLTGLAEGFFEKYSLDKIIKMKPGGVKNIIINSLKSAGIEASEEMATEIADIVIDNAVAMENSENNLEKVRLIREEGLSQEEAERKVFVDNCSSVIWSGVGGGLAGFGFGSISGAVNAVNDTELSDVDNEEALINAIAESLAHKEQLKREPMKSNAELFVQEYMKNWNKKNGYIDEGQIYDSLTRKEELKNSPMKSNAQLAVDYLVDKWASKNGYIDEGIDDFGDINSQGNSYVDSQLSSLVSDSIIENSVDSMLENPEDIDNSDAMGYNHNENYSVFAGNLAHTLKNAGLTSDEFSELMLKDVSSLTNAEKQTLRSIRESTDMPNNRTLMQKVIPISDVSKYLDGTYSQISGFITKAEDVAHLKTYRDIYDSIRLDYPNSSFNPNTDKSLAIIRYCTDKSDKIFIPYSIEMGGTEEEAPPFTGNGFTKAENGQFIPEYKADGFLNISDGAELIEIDINGNEKLIAVYDEVKEKFIFVQ